MRIEACRVKRFGRLADLELTDLGHPLIVVAGSNEAGKSTFFEFLKTMLFGIYPTSAAKHRYVPWSGGFLDGEMSVRLDDGSSQTVSRRLRSTPEGHLLNGSRQLLRNHTLPAAGHVSLELFDSFYALRLQDLAEVHSRPWEEVQERLLGELTPDDLRPVARVLRELEESAGALWRPDRRGKPQARRLQEQLRARRGDVLEARQRDAEARRLAEQADAADRQLEQLQQRRIQLRTRLKQLEGGRPLEALRRQRESLAEIVGDARVLSDLPEDSRARLQALANRRRELERDLALVGEQLDAVRPLARPPDADEELLLEHAAAIRRWRRRLYDAEALQDDGGVEAARASFRSRIEATLGSCPPDGEATWSGVEGALAEALHDLERAGESSHQLERQIRPVTLAASPPAVLAFSAVAWFVLARLAGEPALLAGAVAVVAAAVAAVRAGLLLGRRRRAHGRERAAHQRVERLAKESGLGSGISAARLAACFDELSRARRELAAVEQSRLAAVRRFESEQARAAEFLRTVGEPAADPLAHLPALEERVGDIETRQRQAVLAFPQLEQLERRRQQLEEQLQDCADSRRRLEARLAGIDPDLSAALDRLEERHRALRRLQECERLLTDEPAAAVEGDRDPEAGPETVAALEEELESINRENRRLSAEAATCRARVEQLNEQPTAADVEGEIESLRQQIRQARRERDRLMLLGSLVQRAQQRFRERHQPDVLRRAGRFLETITEGRYRRLDIHRETGRLEVYPGDGDPRPVEEPLSQGTRDQIYLALRLAVVGHLDGEHESLPLFFDEILVNWDSSRRRRGYDVLKELTRQRQLFVFTCHEWLADELAEQAAARRVDL